MTTGVFENQLNFDVLCNTIANFDENIVLVAILNHKGRVIEMASKDEIESIEFTPQKREIFFMQCVLQSTMNKEHDQEFGNVQSSILERKRFTMFSFEMFNYVILAISKPILNPIHLKNGISDIISLNWQLE